MAYYVVCWGDCGKDSNCQYCNVNIGNIMCVCGHNLSYHSYIKFKPCYFCVCKSFTDQPFKVLLNKNIIVKVIKNNLKL